MSSKRRRFDETFKKRAVQLSYAEDRTVKGTAESLGITPDMLHRWRKKYTPVGEKTKMASQAEELVKLQRRIAQLEEENDLLKKASAYFARNQKK